MAGGRPSKYKPEYCEMLITHLSKGFSYESYAAVVKVDFDTLYEWEKVHPEFSEAKKKAIPASMNAIDKILLNIALTGKGNSTAAIFLAKNRHPKFYRDRHEISVEKLDTISDDKLKDLAKSALEFIGLTNK